MRLELKATAALLLAGTLAGCAGLGMETSKVELSQIAINKNEALRQTNAWRAKHSLPPIKLDPHLSEVSQDMANHIARLDSLKTRRHSSSSLISRTQTDGYKSFAGAENLGAGYANISAAMTGWKTSRDHNKTCSTKRHPYGHSAHKPSRRHLPEFLGHDTRCPSKASDSNRFHNCLAALPSPVTSLASRID